MQKIKITKELFGILKAYTKLFNRIKKRYYKKIGRLEKMMQKETGISDIEFLGVGNGTFFGIGTPEAERMDIIHREKLERKL